MPEDIIAERQTYDNIRETGNTHASSRGTNC